MAERQQGSPSISGVAVAALHGRRKQFNRLSMLAGDEMTNAQDATGAHVIGIELDCPFAGLERLVVPSLHGKQIG